MSTQEMILLLQKDDKTTIRLAYEKYYGPLISIAYRFAKNTDQAVDLLHYGFYQCLNKIKSQSQQLDPDEFFESEFLRQCISFIKNIRSEYFVSSTVYANTDTSKTYDLFESNEPVDFKNVKKEIVLGALQKLVPAQRLVFNLNVINGFSIQQTADLLESSVDATRSNLEKARFNFQKNVETGIRFSGS
jgi:RNA polymerase sigma factor (sigma-70 family)